MGQRISIQYTIDMDELGGEVERLLGNANKKLTELSRYQYSRELSLKTIEDIDAIRHGLTDVDMILQDVSAIVSGFVGYKATQQAPIDPPADRDEENILQVIEHNNEEPSKIEYSF
tara:strand:+ start:533 stop:880 length:348 start_codon:yes stop_codon:yes gene_type:complete